MQTKLTLRLEGTLIQQAKNYARQHNKSLSQVVADFFQLLNHQTDNQLLPPITQSLVGFLESSDIDEGDYKKYLEEKYL